MFFKYLFNIQLHHYLFYLTNIVFWSCGWGTLAVGVWLYTQKNIYSILAPASYSAMSAAGLCVAVGAMVLIISFIGCMGNWLRSKCLLISFFCFVSLLFLIQSMTGVMGFLYQDVVRERAKITLRSTISHTHGNTSRELLLWATWNQLQKDLKCCGADNYTDWFYAPRWEGQRFVPDSCCDPSKFDLTLPNSTLHCGKSITSYELLHPRGCASPFTDWLLQHLHIVGIIAILFCFIEIFVLITSLRILCNLHIKEKKRRRHSELHSQYARNGSTARDSLLMPMEFINK